MLGNGLRIVVAPDRSSPLIGVAVIYDVGFRSEPQGRTGFAHLFEHLMFQGSANVDKIEHIRLVQSAGGIVNGHTLPDLTAYYEALPAGELEIALWLEADRMSSLSLTEENLRNQVSVVEEEINVNVLNRPYGGFPWIPLPALAFDTYANAHNGYGDFAHLEEASLEDAADFYAKYYAPSNAVLTVCGDCDPDEVVQLAERHFGSIDSRPAPPHGPYPEPPLESDRRRLVNDPHIPQAAFASGTAHPIRSVASTTTPPTPCWRACSPTETPAGSASGSSTRTVPSPMSAACSEPSEATRSTCGTRSCFRSSSSTRASPVPTSCSP